MSGAANTWSFILILPTTTHTHTHTIYIKIVCISVLPSGHAISTSHPHTAIKKVLVCRKKNKQTFFLDSHVH